MSKVSKELLRSYIKEQNFKSSNFKKHEEEYIYMKKCIRQMLHSESMKKELLTKEKV